MPILACELRRCTCWILAVRTAAYALFCKSWPQTIRTSTSGCRRATCWPRFRGSIRRVVEKGIPTRCQFVAASVVGRRAAGPGLPRRWKLGAGDHREFSRGKESPRKGGCRHSSRTGRLAIGHQLRYSESFLQRLGRQGPERIRLLQDQHLRARRHGVDRGRLAGWPLASLL